ncbi:hypothetical protein SRABI03_02323 [Microbacterium foliorum]|nr:hypothetical protein SRABI03_02323 [Microbacterium foliorum]
MVGHPSFCRSGAGPGDRWNDRHRPKDGHILQASMNGLSDKKEILPGCRLLLDDNLTDR